VDDRQPPVFGLVDTDTHVGVVALVQGSALLVKASKRNGRDVGAVRVALDHPLAADTLDWVHGSATLHRASRGQYAVVPADGAVCFVQVTAWTDTR
jgi:hypothetical protein